MFQKDKEYINEQNLKEVRLLPCVVSGCRENIEAHHIYPRRPRIDKLYNLLPINKDYHVWGVHGTGSEMERVKDKIRARYPEDQAEDLIKKLFCSQYKYEILNRYKEECSEQILFEEKNS